MRKDITDTYMQHNGLILKSGSSDNNVLLMPYLLMDLTLQTFDTEIKPLELRFTAAKWKNEWSREYNAFNRQFFSAFNAEQTQYVIDVMDGLESAVTDEVSALREALELRLAHLEKDARKAVSACLMADVYTKTAISFYDYVRRNGHFTENLHLKKIKKAIVMLLRLLYVSDQLIVCDDDIRISDATKGLSKKMAQWATERN